MKLSIITVNYNTGELTYECVQSVYKHKPSFSFEIIIVDNASKEGSLGKIEKLVKSHKNIKLIRNKTNLGFSKANNIGIKSAKGEYLLLLNSDTKLISPVLEELVGFAQVHPDAGVVAPKLLNSDKSLQPSIYRLPSVSLAFRQYFLGQEGLLEKYGFNDTHDPIEVEAVVGAAFLITPTARKKVGIMNEKYFMYFEDLDYCRAVKGSGLKTYYLPCSYLIHLHGASGGGATNRLIVDSSKKYFGSMRYFVYTFILWSGQKYQKLRKMAF